MIYFFIIIIFIGIVFFTFFDVLKKREKQDKYYFSKYLKRDYLDLRKKLPEDIIFSDESMSFFFFFLYKNKMTNDLNYILDFVFFDKSTEFKINLLNKYSKFSSINQSIKKDVELVYQDQLNKKQYYAYWQNYAKNINYDIIKEK